MRLTDFRTAESMLIADLRSNPNNAHTRMQMFRLAVIDGNWDRAINQLDVAVAVDPRLAESAMVYRRNIDCERLRGAVFASNAAPVFLGTPAPWHGYLVQALQLSDAHASAGMVAQALTQAPPLSGTVNGRAFDWLTDGDDRLGPVLEAFIDGKYYWVPFDRLACIRIAAPQDVLDLAWCPSELSLIGGGTRPAYIPARYPGIESWASDDLKLARRTEWIAWGSGLQKGHGQRVLVSSADEYALLECRAILFSGAGQAA